MEFTLYSQPIQKEFSYTELFKKASEIRALINVDEFNNELILSKVTDELLIATIDAHIEEIIPENYYDQIVPLDGGLRIEHENQMIEHQCCSELNDYKNWEKIISEKSKKWKEIWIGHPSVYYRMREDKIELSEYYEDSPKEENIVVKMVFNVSDFANGLEKALLELEVFKKQIYRIIDDGNYMNKEVLKISLME